MSSAQSGMSLLERVDSFPHRPVSVVRWRTVLQQRSDLLWPGRGLRVLAAVVVVLQDLGDPDRPNLVFREY